MDYMNDDITEIIENEDDDDTIELNDNDIKKIVKEKSKKVAKPKKKLSRKNKEEMIKDLGKQYNMDDYIISKMLKKKKIKTVPASPKQIEALNNGRRKRLSNSKKIQDAKKEELRDLMVSTIRSVYKTEKDQEEKKRKISDNNNKSNRIIKTLKTFTKPEEASKIPEDKEPEKFMF